LFHKSPQPVSTTASSTTQPRTNRNAAVAAEAQSRRAAERSLNPGDVCDTRRCSEERCACGPTECSPGFGGTSPDRPALVKTCVTQGLPRIILLHVIVLGTAMGFSSDVTRPPGA